MKNGMIDRVASLATESLKFEVFFNVRSTINAQTLKTEGCKGGPLDLDTIFEFLDSYPS